MLVLGCYPGSLALEILSGSVLRFKYRQSCAAVIAYYLIVIVASFCDRSKYR